MFNPLKNYRPRKPEYIKERLITLDNAEKLYNGREILIDVFKNKVFPFYIRGQEHEDEGEDEDSPINKLENLIHKDAHKEEK